MITAQVVLINPQGLVLGVSRKDNHKDFGLPGGKMDPEDNNDPMATAIRECKEETGLDITNLRLVFAIHKSGNMGYTYLADYTGEINHNEPHVVKWVPFQVLINGSFGRYNEMVSESLTSMGVVYKSDIDEIALKKELNEFMKEHTFNGLNVSVKDIRKEKDFLGKAQYTLYLTGVVEETCDFDNRFTDGIDAIGESYGVKVRIPTYYYSK
ncbi:MAG: NUDIX hydrolase [Spirochaetes bacterium]|nr:MAG: NUDIX hydrolase [Spirochaetota bacterium]